MKTLTHPRLWLPVLRRLFKTTIHRVSYGNWIARSMTRKMVTGMLIMLTVMAIAIGGSMVLVRQQKNDATLIRMAGRQQVLGQEIAKESLNIRNGDASAATRLNEAVHEYVRCLDILLNGDSEAGLAPATPAVRAELAEVQRLWRPVLQSVNRLERTAPNITMYYAAIVEASADMDPLLQAVQALEESNLSPEAAALLRSQQRLLQEMTAHLLAVSNGDNTVVMNATVTAAVTDSTVTADKFERGLTHLLNGLLSAGVPPADGTFREQLLQVREAWQPVAGAVDTLALNSTFVSDIAVNVATVVENSSLLLAQGDRVVAALEQEAQAKTARMLLFLEGLGVLFVIVFLVAAGIVRSSIKPLQQMISLTQSVAQTDLPALLQALNLLARGDLTATVSVTSHRMEYSAEDELGQMSRMFNSMIEQLRTASVAFNSSMADLRELVGSVQGSANAVADSSYQLNDAAVQSGAATQQITQVIGHAAEGNADQMNRVEDINATIEEQAKWVERIADGATRQEAATTEARRLLQEHLAQAIAQAQSTAIGADRAATSADSTVSAGVQSVEKTILGMQTIADATDGVAQRMQEMNDSSRKIGSIIQTIDEIAERTNLLALNAAIEAARAGEHGRGFAVVADEVRKLAERAARSTGEITLLIQTMQKTVDQSMEAMTSSRQRVQDGLTIASETDHSLGEIRQAVAEVSGEMQRLNQAVSAMGDGSLALEQVLEQVAAVGAENLLSTGNLTELSEQINLAMSKIWSVSKENSVAAEEIFAGAEEVRIQMTETVRSVTVLAGMAEELQEQINHFRTDASASVPAPNESTELYFPPSGRLLQEPAERLPSPVVQPHH